MADFDPDTLLKERPASASMKVRPKLSRDELKTLVRRYNPDITNAAVEGEVDNIERESSGVSTNDTGDSGTSGGLYQHHLSRLSNLKEFAAKQNKSWTDPEIQVQFSRYEKEHDYPSLLKFQQTNNDRAANEDSFKRIFERPASVLWQNNAEGKPVTEGDRFKFSDYAMREFMDQPDTQIRFMDPAEYLKLTPPMEGKPWQSPSGRSLRQSIDKGEPIEQIPSLDVSVNGPTAQVTDQDGRHRMLAAQENGIQAVPVAIKGLKGDPTEIVGHDGVPQAFDHPRGPRQEDPQPQKEPISLLRQIGDAIIPRAEAAEPTGVPEGFKPIQPQQQAQAVPEGFAPIHPEQTGAQADFAKAHPEQFPPAGLTDEQQREWMAENNPFSGTEVAKGVVRGAGPYVAGAGVGAGVGGAFGGPPGAAAGALIGAGAAGVGQLASGVSSLVSGLHVPGPQDATNKLLDLFGVKQPETMSGRMAEAVTGGVANALSGAGGLGMLSNILKNPASKVTANYLTKLASRATTAMADNPALQALSGASGGASAQLAAEAGLPPWAQFLAGLAGGAAPAGRNMIPNLAHQEVTPLARQGIEAGFVLHPADAAPAHTGSMNINDFAMAEASKIKSNQLASVRNGIVSNGLAQEEIGLPRGTTLTPAAFKEAKQPAIAVFREVEKAVPEVDLGKSPTFTNFVKTLGARTAETEKQFPEMAGTPEILELRDQLLRNERASTPAVMEKIADLRTQATANFHKEGDAQAHRLGMAQRQAAQAMEDAMEDSVKNAPRYFQEKVNEARAMRAEATADFDYINKSVIQDPLSPMGKQLEQARRRVEKANADTKKWEDQLANAEQNQPYYQGLPDKFRQARQLFAKIYDVESVTNKTTGDVNARGLARLLEHGKPLTGNLKLIADMANGYARAFQNPANIGGVESMSVLDAAFAGVEAAKGIGKLASGHPGGLANLGLAIAALAKKAIRGNVMSPGYQQRMIAPRGTPTLPASVLTTPFLPTQPVPGNPGGNALMGLMTTQ